MTAGSAGATLTAAVATGIARRAGMTSAALHQPPGQLPLASPIVLFVTALHIIRSAGKVLHALAQCSCPLGDMSFATVSPCSLSLGRVNSLQCSIANESRRNHLLQDVDDVMQIYLLDCVDKQARQQPRQAAGQRLPDGLHSLCPHQEVCRPRAGGAAALCSGMVAG